MENLEQENKIEVPEITHEFMNNLEHASEAQETKRGRKGIMLSEDGSMVDAKNTHYAQRIEMQNSDTHNEVPGMSLPKKVKSNDDAIEIANRLIESAGSDPYEMNKFLENRAE